MARGRCGPLRCLLELPYTPVELRESIEAGDPHESMLALRDNGYDRYDRWHVAIVDAAEVHGHAKPVDLPVRRPLVRRGQSQDPPSDHAANGAAGQFEINRPSCRDGSHPAPAASGALTGDYPDRTAKHCRAWGYVAAIGIPLAGTLGIDLAGLLLGASSLDRVVGALTASALVVPLVVLIPAILEEFGWRGFGVQTAVDDGHSPAWAATVVGLMFVMAHVPLYLPGQLYDTLPLWPLPITLLAYAVLLTWIYLCTAGSILLAGLMHAAFNATLPLTWGLDAVWAWQARAVVFGIIATVLVVISGVQWWRPSLRTRVAGQP